MPEIAQATILVTPVLQGAQEKITNDLTNAATPAGDAAGKAVGTSMSEAIGNKMSGAGAALSKGVTAPLVAIGTAAVASWKEVDTGLDTIVQKTGASGDALDNMGTILNNIATSIPTDFETAGAAIGEVNTRFGVTGAELEKLSGQFIKFADLNGQDVSNSVDSVSKMMAGFGLEADKAGTILDALNTVGQQTGVDVGALADQVAANAKQFQEMGMSAEDAAAFLGSTSMAGLETSTMMMGLKTAMKNAAQDGQTLDQALAGFTETMQGNGSESDKLAAAYELFGTRAGAAIENAVSNGTLNLSDFNSSLGNFEGSVSNTFEGTLDPLDKFKTTMNQIKITGADLVNTAGPMIADIFERISDAVGKVSEKWDSLSPEMQEMILKVAGIAAVAGPLLAIGGKIIGGISKITGGIGSLVGGLGGLGGAASTATQPVASIGASLGTAAAGALKMIGAAAALWIAAQAIKTLADTAIQLSQAGGLAIGILAGMAVGIGALMAVASAVGPGMTAGAVGFLAFGASALMIGGAVALASAGISLVIDAVGRLVSTISASAPGITSIVESIGSTVDSTITTISDGITKIIDAISGGLTSVLDGISGVFDSIGEAALNAGEGFQKLAGAVMDLVNNTGALDLGATMAATAAGVTKIVTAANEAGGASTKLKGISTSLKQIQASGKSAQTGMTSFASAVKSGMSKAADAIKGAKLNSSMKTMMDKVVSSAKSSIRSLQGAFSSTRFSFNQHIAIPHFSMAGSFDAKSGRVPSVNVSWYAKAAQYGAIFDTPTIIGVGDSADREVLLGENKLKEMFGSGGTTNNFYITVEGSEAPEDYARRLMRELQLITRTA